MGVLKIGIRNLFRRKGYTLLNMAGLTLGMTCCLLIFHYVSYEKSYDESVTEADNIYRVRLDLYQKGELAWKSATSYPGITRAMKEEFPEVESYCKLMDANGTFVNTANNTKFIEHKGYFAESSFIEMFNVELISGNPYYALTGPGKMIVSESTAKKYFGTNLVLGKRLSSREFGGNKSFEISGVFKDRPKNSHLAIDYLISYDELGQILREQGDTTNEAQTSFGWYDFYSYVKLKKGSSAERLQSKMPTFCAKYIDKKPQSGLHHEIALIPLRDIHLYSNVNQEAEVNGNGQMVFMLFLIAIFLICMAWVNYINLTTARSVERSKEVGVKKVLGAFRSDLIRQFLVENFLLNFFSLIFSSVLFYFLIPVFDRFCGREVITDLTLSPAYWALFALIFVAGTLLSGLYPAFVLSSFSVIKVLKGAFKNTSSGQALRKGLIVFQFTTTVMLIAGTFIVYQQVSYMRRQTLGADIDQTLVLNGLSGNGDTLYKGSYEAFKNEIKNLPYVKSICTSSNVFGQEIYWTNGIRQVDAPKQSVITVYNLGIDSVFVSSYNMKIKAGRGFNSARIEEVMLNEKAVEMLGFKNAEEAVQKKIVQYRDTQVICGVLADFHQQGLQKAIDPMIIVQAPENRNYYSIRMKSEDVSGQVAGIKSVWDKYYTQDPFNYFFLNESFNEQYKSDAMFGKVFGVFTAISIFIACFGLLGLSAYNVLQRQKEIGIRKVLGASEVNILMLLSSGFMRLVGISLLVSIPIGWFLMNKWLQDFPYRIHIQWWVFVLAGFLALMVTGLTLFFQAFSTLRENPVKNLRTE